MASSSKSKTKSSSTKNKKDTNIVLKCLQSTMESNTTLMWCVIVGLILSSFTTTHVTANSKGRESIPHRPNKNDQLVSTIHEIDQPSSSHDMRHDVPKQHTLKELFSSSSTKRSVHDVQVGSGSNVTSVRHLDLGSTCIDPQWNQSGLDIYGDDVNYANSGDRFHNFGLSVALSADGTVLIAGANNPHGSSGSIAKSGYVKVFAKNSSSSLGWVQLGQTLHGDADSRAGSSVAISANGNVIAFGAVNDAVEMSHVKVFSRDTSTSLGWIQIGSNIEGEAAGDASGYSIALSANGETLAIGAPHNDGIENASGFQNGHVRIYRRDNSSATGFSQVGQDLDGNASRDTCGRSVDLSFDGTIVAVGCSHANTSIGYVKIFKEDISVELGWVQQGGNIVGEYHVYFGWSVALSGLGDIIAIGGYQRNKRSVVRVYQSNSTLSSGWSQLGNDIDGEANYDKSGWSVAISYSGDIVAIGAKDNDGAGANSGHTRVYQRDPTSSLGWVQYGNDVDGESSGDLFGSAVALSANGHVLASGAPSNGDNRMATGHVRVYETCRNNESVSTTSTPTLDPFSWDLDLVTPGYLKNPALQDGVHEFITVYNMADRNYTIEVFKPDCLTQSLGLPLINTTYVSNSLEATFMYNQTIIQSSNLWTANATGGDVDFCLKLSLYSNSSNGILFNFIETRYNIQVELTTGFSTTVDVVRTQAGDGGVGIIDVDENITAYQCNDTYNEISSPPALTQGDSLQICVETEDGSVFEVAKIKDTTISQNGTKSFDYVSNYVDSYWAKTSCQAVNTTASVCKLKMQLLGSYFSDADPADLSVVGRVKMDYLGRRRGRLLLDHHVVDDGIMMRDLQESGNAAIFTVTVPVSSGPSEAEGSEQGGASPEVSIDVGTSSAFGIFYASWNVVTVSLTVSLTVAIACMMRMIG